MTDPADAEASPPEPEVPTSQPPKKGILRIIVVVIGVLAVAGGGYALWSKLSQKDYLPQLPTVSESGLDEELMGGIRMARNDVVESPRSGEAWGHYGMLLRAHEFVEEAEVCFQIAAECDPSDFRWPHLMGLSYQDSDEEKALEWYRRAADADPNEAAPRVAIAELLLKAEKDGEAQRFFREAAKIDARNWRALTGLARVALNRGEFQQAVMWSERAVTHAPARRAPREIAAQALHQLDEDAAAERQLAVARDLPADDSLDDPVLAQVAVLRQDPFWVSLQAQQLMQAGKPDEAIQLLQDSVDEHPEIVRFALDLAQAMAMAGRRDDAIIVLEESIVRFPQSSEFRQLRGLMHYTAKETKEAIGQFRAAIKINEDLAPAHHYLGLCLADSAKFDDAIESFERAITIKPDFVEAYMGLARLYLTRDMPTNAVELLETGLKASPYSNDLEMMLTESRAAVIAKNREKDEDDDSPEEEDDDSAADDEEQSP